MRVAWFSPVPPVPSGVSAYTAELVPRLARHHHVDLVLDDGTWRTWAAASASGAGAAPHVARRPDPLGFDAVFPLGPALAAYRAHDFLFLHDRTPYDLIVYQLGNARCHDYQWPYLLRYPGLVVCHDGLVHHSRARALLARRRQGDYRAEFTWAHPAAPPAVAEYAVAGLGGAPYYFFPWLRPVAARARALAAHTPSLCATLEQLSAGRPAHHLRMGVADLAPPDGSAETPRSRDETVELAAFGLLTEEKRLVPILRALAAVRDRCGRARLRLVGARAPHFDIDRHIAELGLSDVVEVTGRVSDAELASRLASADVCLCLRWPSTGETSASWLRCLAAGRTTVITDLVHTVDVPAIDPRSWTTIDGGAGDVDAAGRLHARAAVCVAIDVLDEDHSLRLALGRLCTDPMLRARLGTTARAWWAEHHTLELMERDYLDAMERAAQAPNPPVPTDFPPHLLDEGMTRVKDVLGAMGVSVELW